jgi:hypothetical protein
MAQTTYRLTLKVERTAVDPTDGSWEPSSVWLKQDDGTILIEQVVRKDGGILYGATEAYWESLSDVVGDADRFVSLVKL